MPLVTPETAGHGVTIGQATLTIMDCVERGGWLSASSGQTGISKELTCPLGSGSY